MLRAGFGVEIFVGQGRAGLNNFYGLSLGDVFQKTGADDAFADIRSDAAKVVDLGHYGALIEIKKTLSHSRPATHARRVLAGAT